MPRRTQEPVGRPVWSPGRGAREACRGLKWGAGVRTEKGELRGSTGKERPEGFCKGLGKDVLLYLEGTWKVTAVTFFETQNSFVPNSLAKKSSDSRVGSSQA